MIELNWIPSEVGWSWITIAPTVSLERQQNILWEVKRDSPGIWYIYLDGCRVWLNDGSRPVVCGSLHEAKCWVEDWERRALQHKMEMGTFAPLPHRPSPG